LHTEHETSPVGNTSSHGVAATQEGSLSQPGQHYTYQLLADWAGDWFVSGDATDTGALGPRQSIYAAGQGSAAAASLHSPAFGDHDSDKHYEPRETEPREHVADRRIDRPHALHGDAGNHHLWIRGEVIAGGKPAAGRGASYM